MKEPKDLKTEKILLSDDLLEDIVGGAQCARRPNWFHIS